MLESNKNFFSVIGARQTMWSVLRAGFTLAITTVVVATGASAPANAQISDQSVNWYIQFVWNNMGAQFSDRDGTVVRINKSKKDEVIVPIDVARHVIVGGWRGARSRICDLPEEFTANFELTRASANRKGKWSSQQRHFMKELFQRVVQLNSGKTKVVVSEDGKVVKEEVIKSKVIKECTDEERESLRKEVKSMVQKANLEKKAAKSAAKTPAVKAATPEAAAAKTADGKNTETASPAN